MASEHMEAALALARRGLRVFPVRPRTKQPIYKGWQEQATTDAETISGWWTRHRGASIGVLCGSESGLAVLDLDRKGGRDGIAAASACYGLDPDEHSGPVVRTPTGGMHLYYSHPGGDVRSRTGEGAIIPGVELKVSGFVVAPPSSHPDSDRAYEWATDDPADGEGPLLLPALPAWALRPAGGGGDEKPPVDALKAGVTAGERNDAAARLAGSYIAKGLTRDEVVDLLRTWNGRNTPPMDERELESVVTSIARRELLREQVAQPDGPEDRLLMLDGLSTTFGVQIRDVVRIGGDPPHYEIHLEAGVALLSSFASQQEWRRVVSLAAKRLPKAIGAKHKPSWDHMANQMMALAREIDPGPEGTVRGEVELWIERYLEQRKVRNEADPCVSSEEPFEHEQRIWLSSVDLARFVSAEFDRRMTPRKLTQLLAAQGIERQSIRAPMKKGEPRLARRWSIACATCTGQNEKATRS